MNEEKKIDNQQGNGVLPCVSIRTFLFSGWYAGEKFEIKIKAVDRETAIAYFETNFPNYRWHMTQELS